ncbi:hypothetical protein, partial [Mycobacterium sp.]|uniref:hypothetical protein n=1 Tax=Mycobacterium sp. TaxID=1785 RepID=UPI001275BE2E
MWLTGGSAAVAAMLGVPGAHAEGVDEINGWTVTPTSDTVELLTNNATLSDPGDALGLGTSPIAGEWDSYPATLSSIGSDDQFVTLPPSTDHLLIQDEWFAGMEQAVVKANDVPGSGLLAYLVPADGGHEVVDLI